MPGAGFINIKDTGYKNISLENKSIQENLDSIVDIITKELASKNDKLINDVSQNIIPISVLEEEIEKYIDINKISLRNQKSREELIRKVKTYIFGYGLLQEFINDKDISDVRAIGTKPVRIKKLGKRKSTQVHFPSIQSLEDYCNYVASKNKRPLSQLNAMIRVTDKYSHGSFILRIDIKISPASEIPTIHIRKIRKDKETMDELQKLEMFDEYSKNFLIKGTKAGLNMLVFGEGGSGKTTIMNALIEEVPHDQSILLMQESEELFSNTHPEIIPEVVKNKEGESDVEYTLRDYTTDGLVSDIDRMIIGELKGAETMDLFNASNTGHIILASLHSLSARGVFDKAIHLMKYSGTDLSHDTLMEMLCSSVHLLVHMENFKCVDLTEVVGYDRNKKCGIYNDLTKFVTTKKSSGVSKGYFEKVNDPTNRITNIFNTSEYLMDEEV